MTGDDGCSRGWRPAEPMAGLPPARRLKASIRKLDGRWVATRPGYGFSGPQVTTHATWKAAKDALLGPASASAGPLMERASYSLGLRSNGWSRRGTIRMEDT